MDDLLSAKIALLQVGDMIVRDRMIYSYYLFITSIDKYYLTGDGYLELN